VVPLLVDAIAIWLALSSGESLLRTATP
jgi:hypothetical protein